MELAFLVAHRAHRRLASKQSTKVEADGRGNKRGDELAAKKDGMSLSEMDMETERIL